MRFAPWRHAICACRYKAFDTETGREVAWNSVQVSRLPPSEQRRVIAEVSLLQKISHKYIIKFYGSWYNEASSEVVFITEFVTSGTLKE